MQALLRDDAFKQVRVIAVSIDTDAQKLRRFLGRGAVTLPVAHDPRFLERVGSDAVPTTIIIDGSGTIRDLWTGWGNDALLERLRNGLRTATGGR